MDPPLENDQWCRGLRPAGGGVGIAEDIDHAVAVTDSQGGMFFNCEHGNDGPAAGGFLRRDGFVGPCAVRQLEHE
eukprot:CAMPEP_0185756470 /NCGR_PEP_ID=MMETSP1174-20130828/14907_1 /TAXON_ID=35687 /ORGANISM="Dictyocha speculum, Strain CCMP1381" /LENGTH=74 /DNA_ID=CAMNT_0028435451 /DNA_START=523 /DNA_END=744 /DNA_ORIENTATION=-